MTVVHVYFVNLVELVWFEHILLCFHGLQLQSGDTVIIKASSKRNMTFHDKVTKSHETLRQKWAALVSEVFPAIRDAMTRGLIVYSTFRP